MAHEGRLVGLAAVRDRREVRRIRFHEHAFERDQARAFLQGLRVLEGDDRRKGDVEALAHGRFRYFPGFREAVHDATDLRRALLREDAQGIGGGLPRMDDQRLRDPARRTDVPPEWRALPRRALPQTRPPSAQALHKGRHTSAAKAAAPGPATTAG